MLCLEGDLDFSAQAAIFISDNIAELKQNHELRL